MKKTRDDTVREWKLNDKYKKTQSSMRSRIVEMIEHAKETVIVSSYLLADDGIKKALTQAFEQGTRCYIMTAAASRLRQEVNTEFDEDEYKRHQAMLSALTNKALIRVSDDFHANIIITDPKSDDARGLLFTANLTAGGLGRNQELFVKLEKDEIQEAMSVLKWAFWEHSKHEQVDDTLRVFKPLGRMAPANPEKILQTSQHHHTIRDTILKILQSNPKKIIISSFGWDERHPIVGELCKLAKHGTEITVLTRSNRKAVSKAMQMMKKANIRVLGFEWLHAKVMISDQHTIVMSANIEERGIDKGFELGILLEGERAEKIRKTVYEWINNYQYSLIL